MSAAWINNMQMASKKYKIGYTTGTFDLFHVGHLNILERAKEQCDCLIVGVSTDRLVEQYKHHLPVIGYEDRARIVAAIRYVDKVIPQTHRNKIKALDEVGFDAMFVGSDWKGSKLFSETEAYFRSRGVDMVYLPHTDGISTSLIREDIHNS